MPGKHKTNMWQKEDKHMLHNNMWKMHVECMSITNKRSDRYETRRNTCKTHVEHMQRRCKICIMEVM